MILNLIGNLAYFTDKNRFLKFLLLRDGQMKIWNQLIKIISADRTLPGNGLLQCGAIYITDFCQLVNGIITPVDQFF